jgi:hypothetical protein
MRIRIIRESTYEKSGRNKARAKIASTSWTEGSKKKRERERIERVRRMCLFSKFPYIHILNNNNG